MQQLSRDHLVVFYFFKRVYVSISAICLGACEWLAWFSTTAVFQPKIRIRMGFSKNRLIAFSVLLFIYFFRIIIAVLAQLCLYAGKCIVHVCAHIVDIF